MARHSMGCGSLQRYRTLVSLDGLGIASTSLIRVPDGQSLEGHTVGYAGSFTRSDSTTYSIGSVYFETDPIDTDPVDPTGEFTPLPRHFCWQFSGSSTAISVKTAGLTLLAWNASSSSSARNGMTSTDKKWGANPEAAPPVRAISSD